jgi:hypothetical protein
MEVNSRIEAATYERFCELFGSLVRKPLFLGPNEHGRKIPDIRI